MTVCSYAGRLCVAIAITLFAGWAQAAVFDFRDAAQFENNFSVHSFAGQGGGGYVWSGEPGAGGEPGRLDIEPLYNQSLSVLFSSFTFDLNAQPAQASILFKGGETRGGAVPRIALLLHTAAEAVPLVSVDLRTVWVQDGQGVLPARLVVGSGDGSAVQDGLAAFTVGHWYGMTSVWSLGDDGNSVQITGELWDYGADGSQPVSLIAQMTAQITDPGLFGNGGVVSPLYLGIVAQNGLGGAAVLDQIRIAGAYSVAFVPEPSLGVFFVLAGAALCVVRRRRALQAAYATPKTLG